MVRWRGRQESDNVEDRRGQRSGRGFRFPMPGRGRRMRIPLPGKGRRGGGMGIMGILIVVGLMMLFGIDPRVILGGGAPRMPSPQIDRTGGTDTSSFPKFDIPGLPSGADDLASKRVKQPKSTPGSNLKDDQAKFVSVIFNDTEDVWRGLFTKFGRQYREPNLILYSGQTQTACGPGMAQMGPFYCPLDQRIYVDLSFFNELRVKFGAPGDFAQAYVIAHEVSHHVQTMLGIAEKVQRAKQQSPRDANRIQVRMELQADCLAGVWANRADRSKHILEPGDLKEGLQAASAIGDDMIQRKMQGQVNPHNFTHGTSEQRVRWFKLGFDTGNVSACDTFRASKL